MRRITIAAFAGGAALALAACGGDGGDPPVGAGPGAQAGAPGEADGEPNGIETKTGREVMTAAAQALRAAGSVRAVARSGTEQSGFDLWIEGDSASGTITDDGVAFDVLLVDGATFMRTADPASLPGFDAVAADQWVKTDGFDFESLSLDGLVEEFEDQADEVDDAVQQTTEAGRPVVAVTNPGGDRFLIANTGAALPVSETHVTDDDLAVTYSEYGADFDIEAPAAFVTL